MHIVTSISLQKHFVKSDEPLSILAILNVLNVSPLKGASVDVLLQDLLLRLLLLIGCEKEARQNKSTAIAEIEALAGRAFTLDAAANDAKDNAICTKFCSSVNSFLDAEHTGHTWINPPLAQLLSFMQHYLHCKQLNPSSTSACVLFPGYLLQEVKTHAV